MEGGSTQVLADRATFNNYGSGAAQTGTQTAVTEEMKQASSVPPAAAVRQEVSDIMASMAEQLGRLQQQLQQQQAEHAEYRAQQQHAMNALLSDRQAANATLSSFRTPPSTRVAHLYAPIDRAPARELNFAPAAAPREQPIDGISVRVPSIKDVLDTVSKYVTPFNGVTSLDKGRTVMSFVENVEMVMGNMLPRDSPHRMMIVQMCLKDAALQWLDNHLREIAEEGEKVGRNIDTHPASWDTEVRDHFILAFTGSDLVEMWIAQLSTLRLGGEKTKTPVELNIQFDSLARHVYPNRTNNNDDLLLPQTYSDIIAASDYNLWKGVMRSERPSTLKEWKVGLARQWMVEEKIRVKNVAQKAASSAYKGYGGWKGRSGQSKVDDKPAASAAVMSATDGAGAEGQRAEDVEEDSTDEHVNAATSTRGGRGGGRGGRGRAGGERQQMSAQRQKLYDEMKCFRCEKTGHTVARCPVPPTPKQQQGKEMAGK